MKITNEEDINIIEGQSETLSDVPDKDITMTAATTVAEAMVQSQDVAMNTAVNTMDTVQALSDPNTKVLLDGSTLKRHIFTDDYKTFIAYQAEFSDFYKNQPARNKAKLFGTRHYIEKQRKLKGLLEPEKLSASDIRELNGTFREKQNHTPLTDKELAEMAEGVLAVNVLAGRIDSPKDEKARQAVIQQITANLQRLNKAGLDIMLRRAQSQYKTESGRLKVARQLIAEEAKMSRTIIAGGTADDVKDDPQPSQHKEENTASPNTAQNEKTDPQPSHEPENIENPVNVEAVNAPDKKPDDSPKKDVVSRLMQYYKDHPRNFADDVESLDELNRCLGSDRLYPMGKLDEMFSYLSTNDILEKVYVGCDSSGDKFDPTRDYFRLTNAGGLVSTDEHDYAEYLNEATVKDIIKNAARLTFLSRGTKEIIGFQPSHEAENVENPANTNTEKKPDKKPDDSREKVIKENVKTEQKVVIEQPVYNAATDQVVGKTVKYAAVMKAYDALDKIAKDIKDHPFNDNMPINHLADAAERAGFELSGIWVRLDGKKNVFRTDIKGMENLTRIDGKRGMTSQELLQAIKYRMGALDNIIKGGVAQIVNVSKPEIVSKTENTEPQTKRGMKM